MKRARRRSHLEAPLLLSSPSLPAVSELMETFLGPVHTLHLCFVVYPIVKDGSVGVPLGKAHGLHRPVLAVSLTALDADMSRLQVVVVVKDEITISIPDGDALVHTVVPGLKALDSPFRCAAKSVGELLLDALPLELPVVPGVDDEVTLFLSVLLVDVPPFAIGGWARIAVQSRRAEIAAYGVVWVRGLMDREGQHRWQRLGEYGATTKARERRGGWEARERRGRSPRSC